MKGFIPFTLSLVFLFSCSKKDATCNYPDNNSVAPAGEIQQLQDSLSKYSITATQHPSGFFYKIKSAGSGNAVQNLCSTIDVSYKGTFFNGKTFDSTALGTTVKFRLGEVITGWQKGIPLVKGGGTIDLYLPPSLAYGSVNVPNSSDPVIPANSYLVFQVNVAAID